MIGTSFSGTASVYVQYTMFGAGVPDEDRYCGAPGAFFRGCLD